MNWLGLANEQEEQRKQHAAILNDDTLLGCFAGAAQSTTASSLTNYVLCVLLERPELSDWLIQREPKHCLYWKKYIQVIRQQNEQEKTQKTTSTIPQHSTTKPTTTTTTHIHHNRCLLRYGWDIVGHQYYKILLMSMVVAIMMMYVLNMIDNVTGLPAFALAATITTNQQEQQLHPFGSAGCNNNEISNNDNDIVETFLKDLVGDWLTIDEMSGVTKPTNLQQQQQQQRHHPTVTITKCDKCSSYIYKQHMNNNYTTTTTTTTTEMMNIISMIFVFSTQPMKY